MKVLLSIKPEFADKIFSGKKLYEYRKTIFKQKVTTIVVYSSSPVQKVIGEFSIEKIYHAEIDELWTKTKDYSGISEDFYHQYFSKKEKGYAIEISGATLYENPLDLKENYGILPPQSFAYI